MDENPYRSPQSSREEPRSRIQSLLALHRCADGSRCRKSYLQLGARVFFVPVVILAVWMTIDRQPPTGVLTAWIFLNAIAATLSLCAIELRCLHS